MFLSRKSHFANQDVNGNGHDDDGKFVHVQKENEMCDLPSLCSTMLKWLWHISLGNHCNVRVHTSFQ